MSDIFREVDDDLRQDRFQALWKKYGMYAVGAAILVVVATAAVTFWKDQRQKGREADGARLLEALSFAAAGKKAEAGAAFDAMAKDASRGYAALARLESAALKSRAGDEQAAVALYEAMAGDSGLSRHMRDLGAVLAVLHGLDAMAPEAAAARLEPIAKDDNPWRHVARELQAALAAKAGDAARARLLYKSLADDLAAPAALRGRASEMLAVIGG